MNAYIQRVDGQVLSILDSFSNYYGGAHGYYGLNGFNYDSQTGEEISIEDVVSSMDDLRNAAAEVFSRDYADLIEAEPGCEDYLAESFDDPVRPPPLVHTCHDAQDDPQHTGQDPGCSH